MVHHFLSWIELPADPNQGVETSPESRILSICSGVPVHSFLAVPRRGSGPRRTEPALPGLLRPGAGAKSEDKGRGEDQVLDQAGGEFARVDVPEPHGFQLLHRAAPESF